MDLKYALKLKPEKAIKYFKSKGIVPSWDWHDIWQEAHAKAFTVAKAMRLDILQDRKELYLTSLRFTNKEDIERILKRGEVLYKKK